MTTLPAHYAKMPRPFRPESPEAQAWQIIYHLHDPSEDT